MLKATQSMDHINPSILSAQRSDFLPRIPPRIEAHKYLRKHDLSNNIKEIKLADAYNRILNKSENQFSYYHIPYDMQIKHGPRGSMPNNR